MLVDLIFITHNRLEYTKVSLQSVLKDPEEEFSLTIWDNASTDGTQAYLRKNISDPRITDIIFSKKNIGQTAATNMIWGKSRSDLLGKLDNDCIVPAGWTRRLATAHQDIEKLGVVAMWHFSQDDFDLGRAAHKIQEFNGHSIFRHPWTCGTGLLIKKATFDRMGPIQEKATTRYWMNMAKAGYINGFYYPLIIQEHMDDPKSEYCIIKDQDSFDRYKDVTYGLQVRRYATVEGRFSWRQEIIRNLLDDPYDIRYYNSLSRNIVKMKNKLYSYFKRE